MPFETIPYSSLSHKELRAIYRRLAVERGLPGRCGNYSRVKLVERIALVRTRPMTPPPAPTPKPKAASKPKRKPPASMMLQTVVELLGVVVYRQAGGRTVGLSYAEIVKRLRRKFAKAKTTPLYLRGVASKIRSGVLTGTLPDTRLRKDSRYGLAQRQR